LAIWSTKGGAGCTVIAAAAVLARTGPAAHATLAVDLGGDLAPLLAGPGAEGPGLADWLAAGDGVPADGLVRIERPLATGGALLTRGGGDLVAERVPALVEALARDPRRLIVDLGDLGVQRGLRPVAAAAERSLLVTRACPLALARLEDLPAVPTGVVVVRDRRRRLGRDAIEAAAAAPVVAEVEVDPAIGAAIDVGLARRGLPRGFLRAIGAVT
jgi:hypothetical protein